MLPAAQSRPRYAEIGIIQLRAHSRLTTSATSCPAKRYASVLFAAEPFNGQRVRSLALSTTRARVRVPGVEVDVRVEDVGVGPSGLREDVDDAYRDKYGGGSTGNMIGDEAAATTLRLLRK